MKDITVANVAIEMIKLEMNILKHAPSFYKRVIKGALKAAAVGGSVYVTCYLKAVQALMDTGRGAMVEYLESFGLDEEDSVEAFESWDMVTAAAEIAEEGINSYISSLTKQYTPEPKPVYDARCASCGWEYRLEMDSVCPMCSSAMYFDAPCCRGCGTDIHDCICEPS